jgi:hypothetical protein
MSFPPMLSAHAGAHPGNGAFHLSPDFPAHGVGTNSLVLRGNVSGKSFG